MTTKCGYIAIIGKPNVGKSTLLNKILGSKLSITSRKPQTTRDQILGVKTMGETQCIYLDTPGMNPPSSKEALARHMSKAASSALKDVDVVLCLVGGTQWNEGDEFVFEQLKHTHAPVILAVNKVDLVKDKDELLPHLETLEHKFQFHQVIPLSAKQGTNVDQLETTLATLLPESPHFFPEGDLTDRPKSFRAAELIREKIIRQLGDELPYATAVAINLMKQEAKEKTGEPYLHVDATIWVERNSQKGIVIGKGGKQLKSIATKARQDLEKQFGQKVFLQCWVKVKSDWRKRPDLLDPEHRHE